MGTYRLVWSAVTVVVLGAAALYDLVSGGWERLALVAPTAAVFGGLLALVLADERPDRWTWTARGAWWAGVAATAADALVVTWGVPGVLAGLVLLAGAPFARVLVRRHFLAWSMRRTTGPMECLGTRDLLRRWEWTTDEVLRPGMPAGRRLALAQERRLLLDEIERRDPLRFADWVVSAVPERTPRPRRR